MVGADFTVKVGDFGLTRRMYSKEYYKKTGTGTVCRACLEPIFRNIKGVDTDGGGGERGGSRLLTLPSLRWMVAHQVSALTLESLACCHIF